MRLKSVFPLSWLTARKYQTSFVIEVFFPVILLYLPGRSIINTRFRATPVFSNRVTGYLKSYLPNATSPFNFNAVLTLALGTVPWGKGKSQNTINSTILDLHHNDFNTE